MSIAITSRLALQSLVSALMAVANKFKLLQIGLLHSLRAMRRVQELLGLGAALDPADRNGSTPLFLACEQGQAGTAALLLRAGACPQAQNRAEERPLYIASLRGHAAVVSELLKAMQSKSLPWQVCLAALLFLVFKTDVLHIFLLPHVNLEKSTPASSCCECFCKTLL